MAASKPKVLKTRIYPYLTIKLHRRLSEYCAKRGVNESAVIEAALAQYLDGTSDLTLLFRRLDAVNRAIHQVHRDTTLNGELFNQWVKVWFRNTPALPPADKQPTTQQSALRYQQMLERLAKNLASGRTFVNDLPQEHLNPNVDMPNPLGAAHEAQDSQAAR